MRDTQPFVVIRLNQEYQGSDMDPFKLEAFGSNEKPRGIRMKKNCNFKNIIYKHVALKFVQWMFSIPKT